MKVLIVGKGSYIGENIKSLLERYNYDVYELDTLSDEWKNFDYSGYSVIIHLAAIVHEAAKSANKELFFRVNTDMPYEIACAAKKCGVNHFIFFSTMAVYGQDKKLPNGNVVDEDTKLTPVSLYGISKYEAEKKLLELRDENYKVSFVRPPNVYGRNCKGNYMEIFRKICLKLPVFPLAFDGSKQSFIYIDNLSSLVRLIIENDCEGLYMPQDSTIPSTNELVKTICDALGKKMVFSKFLGSIVKVFKFIPVVNKLYGGVSYDYQLSDCFDCEYQIVDLKKGIEITFKTDSF